MTTSEKIVITVETTINAPIDKVWDYRTNTQHIIHWYNAADDWHAPKAQHDFKVGGHFNYRMEAKDGSFGFDFEGDFNEIITNKKIAYSIIDGRTVEIIFTVNDNGTTVTETFQAETENAPELQRGGWQAILDNFKKYTETH